MLDPLLPAYPVSPRDPLNPADPVYPLSTAAPLGPWDPVYPIGIVKSNVAVLLVPLFVIIGVVPAAPAVNVPTAIVPARPCEPVYPIPLDPVYPAPAGPCDPVYPTAVLADPVYPVGIVKLSVAALVDPAFVTTGVLPGVPAATVPTAIVAALPCIPWDPVYP